MQEERPTVVIGTLRGCLKITKELACPSHSTGAGGRASLGNLRDLNLAALGSAANLVADRRRPQTLFPASRVSNSSSSTLPPLAVASPPLESHLILISSVIMAGRGKLRACMVCSIVQSESVSPCPLATVHLPLQ